MGTRFEVLIEGLEPAQGRAAAEEALDQIEQLDAQLSAHRNTSEIFRLNTRGAREWVRLSPGVFKLLLQAHELTAATNGAFDITIGPLMKCWGFWRDTGSMPSTEAVEAARELVGIERVQFDSSNCAVRFEREGMMLDLGALGKGHALDQAAETLRELGVKHALLHGGTSTTCSLGRRVNGEEWRIAVEIPTLSLEGAPKTAAQVETFAIEDSALSVSAPWGKSFVSDGRTYGHVIDPRTGTPQTGAMLAVVCSESAAETDAFSTALLTLNHDGMRLLRDLRPNARLLLVRENEGALIIER
jgi:thiamine biosynthesis lipoprotein